MSGNALEAGGTISGGGIIAIAMGWIEINSTSLTIIIMAASCLMMGAFYYASIYMRKIEVREAARDAVIKELFEKILAVDATTQQKEEAKMMIKGLMNRRDR